MRNPFLQLRHVETLFRQQHVILARRDEHLLFLENLHYIRLFLFQVYASRNQISPGALKARSCLSPVEEVLLDSDTGDSVLPGYIGRR